MCVLGGHVIPSNMASQPGILTDWPWKPLGSFKYVLLAPWVVHTIYSVTTSHERDLVYCLILPILMARLVHNQIWISVSRHRTAQGKNRIIDRGLEFSQVDRESNWDDNILLTAHIVYIAYIMLPEVARNLPLWRTDGVVLIALLHAGPVEFLYYWFHRALHHHFLYSRYHSHHHSSIVTQPISAVAHPFVEVLAYVALFAIPQFATLFMKTASVTSVYGYLFYIDFMNNLGHCNFEFFPKKLFSLFPFLKYLTYTPSFHSLHHTKFRTNYSLFMPMYDYIYGTVDESSDDTYETSLKRPKDSADVVHLTHLTTPESVFYLPLGFASLASNPQTPKWYLRLMRPFTFGFIAMAWIFGRTFVSERNTFKKLNLQSWVVPRFTKQEQFPSWKTVSSTYGYTFGWQMEVERYEKPVFYTKYLKGKSTTVNKLIEEAILEAELCGAKVLSLGLLNQEQELNAYEQLYIHKFPKLKIKVIDGSSLAAAVVVNKIPKSTTQVLLRGNFNKVSLDIFNALTKRDVQVAILNKDKMTKLHSRLKSKVDLTLTANYDAKAIWLVGSQDDIVLSQQRFSLRLPHRHSFEPTKIWLVGDGWDEDEQMKATKGTMFIPFSQFPPKKMRKDCFYHHPPAMMVPSSFTNTHSCENWLPRRAMSAWRIAGIVHALEGWNVHECGSTTFNITQIWNATIRHGFQPLDLKS